MAGAEPTLSRHDLEAKIVKRCWEDEGFRAEFTADPAGAFVKYLAVPAAEIPGIAVYQEEPGSWHIVIPERPVSIDELSDRELERVAGGTVNAINSVVQIQITLPAFRSLLASAVTVSAVTVGSVVSTGVGIEQGW
jgi:hypothetical protein